MSVQPPKSRVLFIGIVQDGKVVQERAVGANEAVSVGTSPMSTFVLPATGLEQDPFPLFVVKDGEYHLQFSGTVKGRLTSKGERLSLEKAVKDGAYPVVDGVMSVPLDENDKGKLRIDPVTVLFKFVEPAVIPAPAPVDKYDFRPHWFIEDDEDPVWLGMLAVWTALGIVFSVWASFAEPPEVALEELPDRFTKVILQKPPELDDVQLEDETKEPSEDALQVPSKVKAKASEPEPSDRPPKTEEEEKVEKAEAVEDAKDDLRAQSALFKELQARMIGTTGENARNTVLLDNSGDDFRDIADRLAAAEAVGASIGDGSRIRGSDATPGGTAVRDIGGVEAGVDQGGDIGVAAAPKLEAPSGRVTAGELDVDGDAAPVAKVVRRYQGQLKYCYEKSLKAKPSLSGRVVVGWVVESGAAEEIFIIENTTGDEEIASCIKGKIKRWGFDGVDDGDAKQTFVFTPED